MVHSTTMTVLMAEKDPPVFRDFLGIGRDDERAAAAGAGKRGNNAGLDEDGDAEVATRELSGSSGRFEPPSTPGLLTPPFAMAFPTSAEPGSEGWLRARAAGPGPLQHHGVKSAFYRPETDNNSRSFKRRESPAGRESLQERLQMSVEALENSRPLKVARVEQQQQQKDEKKSKFRNADELRLSMQPPRLSGKGPASLQAPVSKPDLPTRITSKQERPRTPLNSGTSTPVRLGGPSERTSPQLTVDNNLPRESMGLPPIVAPPAADEGSRTGMKGSGLLAGLQQQSKLEPTVQLTGMSNGPSPPPRRSKVSTHSAGSDSMLPSKHQFSTPPSRQLTIFYGGQAHVFDDVPPAKATQIMQLAGANGRSWSTAYSPRQTANTPQPNSEGSLLAMEREKAFSNLSRSGAVSGGNLALSSEVQTLLRGLAQSGASRSAQGSPSGDVTVPTSSEMHLAAAERAAASAIRKDSLDRRSVARPSAGLEDSAKEALLRGQQWI